MFSISDAGNGDYVVRRTDFKGIIPNRHHLQFAVDYIHKYISKNNKQKHSAPERKYVKGEREPEILKMLGMVHRERL